MGCKQRESVCVCVCVYKENTLLYKEKEKIIIIKI